MDQYVTLGPVRALYYICKSIHEWFKIRVFVLDEYENLCE